LIEARLVSIARPCEGDQPANDALDIVNIIHEALIMRWNVLRERLSIWHDALQQRRRFEEQLHLWIHHEFSEKYLLLTSVEFEDANALVERNDIALRDEYAQKYISASKARAEQEAHRQERARYLRQALGGAVGVGLGYGIYQSAFFYTQSAIQPGSLILGTLLIFLVMCLFGVVLGLCIGIGLYLSRHNSARRVALAAWIGALAGIVFQSFYLIFASESLEGRFVHFAIGALVGGGLGFGVALATIRKQQAIVVPSCTLVTGGLAAVLPGLYSGPPEDLRAVAISFTISAAAALAMGIFTAIGFSVAAVET
jgi:hypothetical protein